MQFRVVIPEHVRAGQYIKVHCPADGKGSAGREAELRVPKGLKPGDSFVFDISDKDSSITIANDVDLLNHQINNAASSSGGGGGSSGGASGSNKQRGSGSSSSNNNSRISTNFLDREVLHLKDFLIALGIGLIIGISIVAGFVMGILSATSGIQDTASSSSSPPSAATATPSAFHHHSSSGGGSGTGSLPGGGDGAPPNPYEGLYQLRSVSTDYGYPDLFYSGISRNVPREQQQNEHRQRQEL